jgi:hypothetical protein
MRTTTGRCRAEKLCDAADLPRQHPPELVPLLGDRDPWIRVLADGLTLSLRLEVAVSYTATSSRNLRDVRSVGPAGRCTLWTRRSATSAPTCDVSAQRRCRVRYCRRSERYLSSGGQGVAGSNPVVPTGGGACWFEGNPRSAGFLCCWCRFCVMVYCGLSGDRLGAAGAKQESIMKVFDWVP